VARTHSHGDELLEYFSPTEWFNAFAVYAPDGELRGWYANVTYPTTIDAATEPPTLGWRDLYLDVVVRQDGTHTLRDEDELEEAALDERDPALLAAILRGRDAILGRLERGQFPFGPAR
jgi:predicted RNA-binding protein associated with RNAse of E/G family